MARKKKSVDLPGNTEKVAQANTGDTIVCRLTKPVSGAQYANLMTRLNRTKKLAGVNIVVLPYELKVEKVKPADK